VTRAMSLRMGDSLWLVSRAVSQGALSLVRQNAPRKDVEATSRLLFDAVVNELSRPPSLT
jgi:hypothetical protein